MSEELHGKHRRLRDLVGAQSEERASSWGLAEGQVGGFCLEKVQ